MTHEGRRPGCGRGALGRLAQEGGPPGEARARACPDKLLR